METIKRIKLKLEVKWRNSLLRKNLKLKGEIKKLELDKQNLIIDKRELYDLINVQQAQYHELDLLLRKIKDKLNKSDLFKQLMEVFENEKNIFK